MEEKLMDKSIERKIGEEEELFVPNSINIKLDKIYESIRQENIIMKKRKKKFKKMTVSASLVFVIISAIITNPALAENIPGLNELSNYLKSMYLFNDNYISNADKINISQKEKGIEINLEGVIYDESSLKFIYTLTSEKKLQWGVQLRKNTLNINGKTIEGNSERIRTDDEKMNDDDGVEKYAVITSFDISDLKLDDRVDIDWTINEIHVWDGNYENGNWEFKFKTSKEELKETSKVVNANYSIEIEGYKLFVDKIIFTPTEIKITSKEDKRLISDKKNAYEEWKKDKSNKELKEKLDILKNIERKMDSNNMIITDEEGNTLVPTHGYGSTVKEMIDVYKPLSKIPEKLIFTPIDQMEKEDGGGFKVPFDYQYIPLKNLTTPFEYVQGDNMSIVINSIENDNGKVKINASFKGDFIGSRVEFPFEVIPKEIKYSDKGEKPSDFYDLSESIKGTNPPRYQYAEKANNNNNTFDYEYELKEDEEYNIVFKKIPEGHYKKEEQFSIDVK